MRTTAAGVAERRPHRSPPDHLDRPAVSFRRGELAAALAAVAVGLQLLFAPITLVFAAVLTVAGRILRWRPRWLLLPALAGACWLAAVGMPAAVAALEAGSGRLMTAELAAAAHPGRLLHLAWLLHPAPAFAGAGAGRWPPRELPLALLAGTAEAAVAAWVWAGRRPRSGTDWRPGPVTAARRRAAVAALTAGHTVTASGCSVGVEFRTGRLTGFSWAEAEHGVLLAGQDDRELGQLGLAAACAALRRRKTVLVVDLGDRADGPAARVALLASRLGVPVTSISAPGSATAAVIGRAIRSRGVAVVPAGAPEPAQQALSDLTGVLTSLRDLGLRGDCLAWVTGCDRVAPESLTGLLALGPATGTAILLSTTSAAQAANVAAAVGMTIACGYIPGELAGQLAGQFAMAVPMGRDLPSAAQLGAADATSRPLELRSRSTAERSSYDILRAQSPGAFTLISSRRPVRHGSGLVVPIELTEVR